MATTLLKPEEVRGYAPERLNEAETNIRKELAEMRMNIYEMAGAKIGDVRKLKTNLARVLTVKTEKRKGAAAKAKKTETTKKNKQ